MDIDPKNKKIVIHGLQDSKVAIGSSLIDSQLNKENFKKILEYVSTNEKFEDFFIIVPDYELMTQNSNLSLREFGFVRLKHNDKRIGKLVQEIPFVDIDSPLKSRDEYWVLFK